MKPPKFGEIDWPALIAVTLWVSLGLVAAAFDL